MPHLLTARQTKAAAQIIEQGGVVAFRTETVFGLGADAYNPDAIAKVFAMKNRPVEKNLVMQFPSIKALAKHFPNETNKTAIAILKKFRGITVILSNNQGARIPNDRIAKKVLRACKNPLVVTSANISGEEPATTWQEVQITFSKYSPFKEGGVGEADGGFSIIKSPSSPLQVPSTIVRLEPFEILRNGCHSVQQVIDFYAQLQV